MEKPWSSPSARVVQEYQTSPIRGLATQEARRRLRLHGPNQLSVKAGPTSAEIFWRQLQSPLIYILVIAGILSLYQRQLTDAAVILVVVILNTLIGWIQEYRAEKTMAKLHQILAPKARVIRDGIEQKIASRLLVRGDILLLEAGDRVAADARLISSQNLRVNQSSLTGESVPAHKRDSLLSPTTSLLDQTNMVYLSTLVVTGQAVAVVTGTGMKTEIGTIAEEVVRTHEQLPTLNRRINQLGRWLLTLALVLATIVFLAGLWKQIPLIEMAQVTISLLVSMVPEGLPVAVTVVLSVGLLNIYRHKAVVRKLAAAETLGGTTVICVDKTGTITEGVMMVEKLFVAGVEIDVDGHGYALSGHFYQDGEKITVTKNQPAKLLLELTSLATMSTISKDDLAKDTARQLTDPTETALAVVAAKAGFYAFREEGTHPELLEIPFDQELRYSTSVHKFGRLNRYITKGAAEKIIHLSTEILGADNKVHKLLAQTRSCLTEKAAALASAGYRVTAVGYVDRPSTNSIDAEYVRSLTFLGLIAMADPIRSEARRVIEEAEAAGVRIIMITGDHLLTAQAIARRIGLDEGKVVHADELGRHSLKDVSVIARATPSQKLAIVERLQQQGEIVAMTGDGVNDAPALKRADIGIAMGRNGTDVAIEASEMVLLQDTFGSIVTAIRQGRLIWENLRKVIFYLVSTSLAEALIVIVALLINLPLPLIAVQILWMNLATDGVTSLALTVEGEEGHLMKRPPRPANEPLIDWAAFRRLLLMSGVMTLGTLYLYRQFLPLGVDYARTVALSAMVFFQLFNLLNARSAIHSIFSPKLGRNSFLFASLLLAVILQLIAIYHPLGVRYLQTVPLELNDLGLTALIALSIVLVDELRKGLVRLAHAWAKSQQNFGANQ